MREILIYVKKYRWLCLFSFVVIPVIIYLLSVPALLPSGGNDWAGFWGGYLGAIIGAFVAIYVMGKTLENERNRRREEESERFFHEICELVAEYCATINQSNCHLLRFHQTKAIEWNYEAVYTKSETTKIEHILQIKLLSRKADSYNLRDKLLGSILEVGKATEHLHSFKGDNFEMLEKEADDLSEKLSDLMEVVFEFISENEG